ncbi:MAG: hypothetical protein HY906_10035 [Deltaproteobacteria bacterium]|nr:hypothetical protein [Deltaproteobacteria bacterium]
MRTLWVLVVAGLVVPLGTCSSTPRSCKTLPPLPRVAACAVPEGGWSQGGHGSAADGYSVMLAGRIASAVDGAPPDGCFDSGAVVGTTPRPTDAPFMWWFRAADTSGKSWTVGALVPQLQRPVAPGQLVSAEYQWSARGFSPTLGRLEVRDGTGSLLLWLGQGGDIPDLALPVEVATLRRGDARCQERERCGAWRGHDLVISTGAAQATLRYGRESVLGDLRLVHGGYDLASSYTGCSDWYVASILVAAVPAFPVARPAPTAPRDATSPGVTRPRAACGPAT